MQTNRLEEIYIKLSRAGWIGPARTSLLMAEAKVLYEEMHPECTAGAIRARGCNLAKGNHVDDKMSPTSFSKEVVKETGLHLKKVQRFIRWGTLIRKEVLEAIEVELKWDKGKYLEALVGIDAAFQMGQLAIWKNPGKRRRATCSAPRKVEGKWWSYAEQTATRFHLPGVVDLRLADSREELKRLIEDDIHVDAVISDPPYGIGYKAAGHLDIEGDEDAETIAAWSVPLMVKVLKNDSAIYLCSRWDVEGIWSARLTEQGAPPKDHAIWDKVHPSGVGGTDSQLRSQFESIIIAHKDRPKLCQWVDEYGFTETEGRVVKRDINLWTYPVPKDQETRNAHPTPKPVELGMRMMLNCTVKGDLVVDPFMGCGPFGVAAVRLGRNYIGIEKDPAYFSVAVRRIQEALDEREPIHLLEAPREAA